MHIKTISLHNYRGAQSLTMELQPHLNVLVGCNGAGKSTILDAIALMLSWTVSRIQGLQKKRDSISEEDIKIDEPNASIEISLIDDDKQVKWLVGKRRQGSSSSLNFSDCALLNKYVEKIQASIIATKGKTYIPIFVFYPVGRAVNKISLKPRQNQTFDLMEAYDQALIGSSTFMAFFQWFREREDLENESRKFLTHSQDFSPDPQLEAVRNALKHFLPDFENLNVRRNPLRMEIQKWGQFFTINQLSDGEKCLIAMIGDIARRLAIANPIGNPLEGKGIVLIDEIDLHLHPTWQRMIIPQLVNVFPYCQFIVSTHSPHVLTHVQPDNIFLLTQTLDNITVTQPSASYGKTVDRILEDLMGLHTTRPQQVSQDLHRIYELIDQGELPTAKQAITDMKVAIGNDPELVKAEVLIRRKEIIGR
ncbi:MULTISPECIES: AAA family ATPase [Synechocystis]|uniref:AAA family ATPase n=1 Tax=Synechocystis salina LEGE 00031 TaxID=1828736 RepID=A0ABR9VNK1_9SYNC|nr:MULTISPECIES: AAA family ATPase [Synechocystis]MBD2654863.1 AAA family ATPase [Synechocystis sp. FACHB-383]MBE9239733.1 AAA family ATPase [Synechocystis salina LEGE 00041]MBE9252468.1 AAA family ATPase [Synechocystis salina LEGE 00031]